MKILNKQYIHIMFLAIFLPMLYFISKFGNIFSGTLFGISSVLFFYITIAWIVMHHIYVLLCWRIQLYYSLITRVLGKNGFKLYCVGFGTFLSVRFLLIFLLAISNKETIQAPYILFRVLAAVLLFPTVYLFFSVVKYFGLVRAFGIDHFDPEYQKKPFVKKGIFKYTTNGMYTFGMLGFWIPGLWFLSKAAIIVALFNHIYVWIHYYSIEKPDMQIIYSGDNQL